MSASELGREFDLNRMLNHGYLPRIYEASRPRRLLDAYVADYLKDEIAAEGLVSSTSRTLRGSAASRATRRRVISRSWRTPCSGAGSLRTEGDPSAG
jgi:hypothetical protein